MFFFLMEIYESTYTYLQERCTNNVEYKHEKHN